jgi:putative NADH-flavin reductase
MNVLVVGATGNTGRPLVEQLLAKGHMVRAIVRSRGKLPAAVLENSNATIIEASLLDLSEQEMAAHVKGCDAVASCLGHVPTFKGVFGEPRKLCTDAVRRLSQAIEANQPSRPVKFVLMNTVGVGNADLDEARSAFDRGLLFLIRHLVPAHRDNETAVEHLRGHVGVDSKSVEWCSVRPDSLINADVSAYDIVKSPVTSILSGRPTTRSNVAQFMAALIDDADLWAKWRFKMPVIMNSGN